MINYLPVTGSEPSYNPNNWKDVEDTHNCYSYAMDDKNYKLEDKAQPGYASSKKHITSDEYYCDNILGRIKSDTPSLIIKKQSTKEQLQKQSKKLKKPQNIESCVDQCEPIEDNDRCPKNYYKGFLAIDPKKGDKDYHFYRQDKQRVHSKKPNITGSYWSHKPGKTPVRDTDSEGKPIVNPLKASRGRSKSDSYQYIIPCGFFCIPSVGIRHLPKYNVRVSNKEKNA